MLKLGHFEKDHKYLRSFEMWWWVWMEKISWTHSAKNTVLHRVEEENNIVLMIRQKKVTWTGHTLCTKCLLNPYPTNVENRVSS